MLFLNAKNRLLRDELISEGSVNETPIYPREIMRRALELGATALILAHNHPSGDPAPSEGDIQATRRDRRRGARARHPSPRPCHRRPFGLVELPRPRPDLGAIAHGLAAPPADPAPPEAQAGAGAAGHWATARRRRPMPWACAAGPSISHSPSRPGTEAARPAHRRMARSAADPSWTRSSGPAWPAEAAGLVRGADRRIRLAAGRARGRDQRSRRGSSARARPGSSPRSRPGCSIACACPWRSARSSPPRASCSTISGRTWPT